MFAKLFGHSQVTLTLDTYSHLVPGLAERATDRLAAILSPPADKVRRSA